MNDTMQLVDLHTHTTASDGTDTPTELVRKAHAAGLAAVAVTDHDTIAGLAEAEQAGQELGLPVIRGCEISTRTEYGGIHILGLWIPREAPQLEHTLQELHRNRKTRNQAIVAKLQQLGLSISLEEAEAKASGNPGRPHIAEVLVEKGYVKDMREAFTFYLGANGKAYVPKETLKPEDAVKLLVECGATPCMAHPMLQGYPVTWLEARILHLRSLGLDALEIWHSEHSDDAVRTCLKWAKQFGLGECGGSDYHGRHKPGISLGTGRGNLRVPLSVLEGLVARRRSQGLPC